MKKRTNLSNLYEDILLDEKPDDKVHKNKVEELKQLTKTPKKESYNEMPHYHVLQPNYLNQADILFLPTAQYGYKYLLVVTDANTKKVDAEPMKNKDSLSTEIF